MHRRARLGQSLGWALLLWGAVAFGKSYPAVPVGPDDLEVTSSARTDLALRLELIRRARRTLDVAVYEQTADAEVGRPVLQALRDAADRGVKVRLATCFLAQVVKDPHRDAERFLTNPPIKLPIQVILFGGERMQTPGPEWKTEDQLHEKLLLVDGELLLTTGRGHSKVYLDWLDTSFLVRGPLAEQAQHAFGRLWNDALAEAGLFHEPYKNASRLRRYPRPASTKLNPEEQAEFKRLVSWLDAPRKDSVGERGRVLHFDMIRQVRAAPQALPRGAYARAEAFDDAILEAFLERLKTAKRVRFTTLSVILDPRLESALLAAAEQGTRITVMTNGFQEGLHPYNIPWRYSLPEVARLLEHPNISIHAFLPGKGHPYTYLHRKLAVVDDVVLFGSHNLNLPSSANNDELSFEVDSPSFARRMEALFDKDLSATSRALSQEEIQVELQRAELLGRELVTPFIGLF